MLIINRIPLRARTIAWVSSIALFSSHGTSIAADNYEAIDEEVLRVWTARYSDYIGLAYYKLEDFINRKAETSPDWTNSDIPPAETGWDKNWTKIDLKARYCDQTLIVYIGGGSIMGIYDDQHRRIQTSPAERSQGKWGSMRKPSLQWLVEGQIEPNDDWPTVVLPACMVEAYGKSFPSGRAAMAGYVKDRNLEKFKQDTYETRTEPCGENKHGTETTYRRSKKVGINWRGQPVGTPVYGKWEVMVDTCRDDFTSQENFFTECTWYEGSPHNKQMTGSNFWTRQKTVTAAGIVYGDPVFGSSTCWDQSATTTAPLLPDPKENTVDTTETQTVGCSSGFTGSITQSRTISTKTTTFAWNQKPVVSVEYSAWSDTSNSCTMIVASNGSAGRGEGSGGATSVDTNNDGIGDSPMGTKGDVVDGHPQQSPPGTGQGGSDGGARVICTQLYSLGLLSLEDYLRDLAFTHTHLTQAHIDGYHYWAIHVVRTMRREDMHGKLTVKLSRYIAQARANDIAFIVGASERYDWAGRVFRLVGEPLCYLIGRLVGKQDWQQLYQENSQGGKL
ncbi:MAG: hypothetical protein GY833_13020 [Aestuariibacter sp.]|nr:hypothetical protein [Aestuariibacter sp.]